MDFPADHDVSFTDADIEGMRGLATMMMRMGRRRHRPSKSCRREGDTYMSVTRTAATERVLEHGLLSNRQIPLSDIEPQRYDPNSEDMSDVLDETFLALSGEGLDPSPTIAHGPMVITSKGARFCRVALGLAGLTSEPMALELLARYLADHFDEDFLNTLMVARDKALDIGVVE